LYAGRKSPGTIFCPFQPQTGKAVLKTMMHLNQIQYKIMALTCFPFSFLVLDFLVETHIAEFEYEIRLFL